MATVVTLGYPSRWQVFGEPEEAILDGPLPLLLFAKKLNKFVLKYKINWIYVL